MRAISLPSIPGKSFFNYLALSVLVITSGVFLGIVAVFLPFWLVFSFLVLPLFALILFTRPEYALVAFIGLACGLIHPSFVPKLPFLGGAVGAADLALAMLALYVVIVHFVRKSPRDRPAAQQKAGAALLMRNAYIGFMVLFMVAVIASLTLKGLEKGVVLGEARDLGYLLVLPLAIAILDTPVRQIRFVRAFVALGLLFSVGQILQGLFDIPVFGSSGRLEVLETLGQKEYGATRSLTRGINIIIMSLLLLVGGYVLGRIPRLAFFVMAGLLGAGIFLTFGRTTFAVVGLSVSLIVVWLNPKKIPELSSVFFLALVIAIAGVAFFKPAAISGVIDRVTNTGTELRSGASAQWRYEEAQFMIPKIVANPFLGIGLGAEYKSVGGSWLNPDLNRYMHNAYLYMAGKIGVPALMLFLLFMFGVYRSARRSMQFRELPAMQRVVLAVSAAMMIRFALASITEPHFMADYSLTIIALCGGLVWLFSRTELTPPGAMPISQAQSSLRVTARAHGAA